MNDITPTKNYQTFLLPVLGIILLLAIAWGVAQLNPANNPETSNVNLSLEQQESLEREVAATEHQLNDLPENASVEERTKLYIKLASLKYNLGLYDAALAALDKVKDANQNTASLWQRYALIFRDMGDLDKARENAKRALDLETDNPQYWLTYIETSAKESADTIKGLYNEALSKTENNIGIVTAYAQFLEKIGDKQGAIEQWRKAIEIFPQGKADYEKEINRLQAA